jgi:hypothetical protein
MPGFGTALSQGRTAIVRSCAVRPPEGWFVERVAQLRLVVRRRMGLRVVALPGAGG